MDFSISGITDTILEEEGPFFTQDPADPGGATKWGVTLKPMTEYLGRPATVSDIQTLDEATARDVYRKLYIEGPGYTAAFHGPLLGLVVDCAVNNGRGRTNLWIQRTIGVAQDSVFGPITAARAKAFPGPALYWGVLAERIECYGELVRINHVLVKFIHGWLERACRFIRIAASVDLAA